MNHQNTPGRAMHFYVPDFFSVLSLLRPISTQENFPWTENFPKISLLKFVSANHILQIFLSAENSLEWKQVSFHSGKLFVDWNGQENFSLSYELWVGTIMTLTQRKNCLVRSNPWIIFLSGNQPLALILCMGTRLYKKLKEL